MITFLAPLTVRTVDGPELDGWDDTVRRFAHHRVTHLRAWIMSLEQSGHGRPLYLVFERDGDVVGCLPGLLQRIGPHTVFGSPMAGWQTASMGPAFDPQRVTTGELIGALVPYLEEEFDVAHIEMLHTDLDPLSMAAAGFACRTVFTFRAPMTPGHEARTFEAMKDSARRNITRAERLGLVVSFAEDERFVDEHYRLLGEAYHRNGTFLPFDRRRIEACFRALQCTGNLLAVRVALPGDGVTIATGMFFVEGRELSLWTWAHGTNYRWYRPTELMAWAAMQRAMATGCDTFDQMGGGEFKTRLGGAPDLSTQRWVRSRPAGPAGTGDVADATVAWPMSPPSRACVVGDIDLVRTLALAGIPVTVAAPPGDPARSSRHVTAVLPWNHPTTRPAELVDTLMAHGMEQPEPPTLFYASDEALLMVSRHREELREAFRFVVPDAALVEQLVDQERFHLLAQRLRLPVPETRVLRPLHEPSYTAEAVRYPVILTPAIRRPGAWRAFAGDARSLRVESRQELVLLWPRLASLGHALLAQHVESGAEARIESYHTYVDESGAVVADFTGRTIRTWPAYGDGSALEISDARDLRDLGRDIVGRLGLRGVATLDFQRGADGRLLLLEVHPCFTPWHHLAASAGLNIPALVHGDLTAAPRPSVMPAVRPGARWCEVWTDWRAARASGLALWRWLLWAVRCDTLRGLSWRDPWSLLGAIAERGRELLRRVQRDVAPRRLTLRTMERTE